MGELMVNVVYAEAYWVYTNWGENIDSGNVGILTAKRNRSENGGGPSRSFPDDFPYLENAIHRSSESDKKEEAFQTALLKLPPEGARMQSAEEREVLTELGGKPGKTASCARDRLLLKWGSFTTYKYLSTELFVGQCPLKCIDLESTLKLTLSLGKTESWGRRRTAEVYRSGIGRRI